jgi:hypothetical protein
MIRIKIAIIPQKMPIIRPTALTSFSAVLLELAASKCESHIGTAIFTVAELRPRE